MVPVPLETMLIPVQTLCIMLPVEEQVGLNQTAAPPSSLPVVEKEHKDAESPKILQEKYKELMEAVGKLQEAVEVAAQVEKKVEEDGEVVQQVPRRSALVRAWAALLQVLNLGVEQVVRHRQEGLYEEEVEDGVNSDD